MKTTIEISDDLFVRIQKLALEKETTFDELTEMGLRMVLGQDGPRKPKKLLPLVTVKGRMTEEFKNANWEEIRDEIYKGRGA